MKIDFRPMPVLSVIVVIMLGILISLGSWQYKRLQWKTDLLAEVEASVTAPPITSLDALDRAIQAGDPVDFRRIVFQSSPVTGEPIYAVYKPQRGGIFWDLYQRYGNFFARYETVLDADKPDGSAVSPANVVADFHIGYIRKNHAAGTVEGWVKAKSDRGENYWYKFDQSDDWGGDGVRTSHYINIEKTLPFNASQQSLAAANDLPIKRPSIRNNHRDYMLTWFSFAGLLILFYFLIHKREGRLSW